MFTAQRIIGGPLTETNWIFLDESLNGYFIPLWSIVLVLFIWGGINMPFSGERDNRFKTGYKNNDIGDEGNIGKGCLLLILAFVYMVLGIISIEGG